MTSSVARERRIRGELFNSDRRKISAKVYKIEQRERLTIFKILHPTARERDANRRGGRIGWAVATVSPLTSPERSRSEFTFERPSSSGGPSESRHCKERFRF